MILQYRLIETGSYQSSEKQIKMGAGREPSIKPVLAVQGIRQTENGPGYSPEEHPQLDTARLSTNWNGTRAGYST